MKKLGGETVQSADQPGVTHVVFPFGPKGDPDDGKQYLRTLEVGREGWGGRWDANGDLQRMQTNVTVLGTAVAGSLHACSALQCMRGSAAGTKIRPCC